MFELDKRNALSKIDKSKKGSIDKKIKKLVEIINSKENYYTSSSCSGRIVIYETSTKKKKDVKWLFVSHDVVPLKKILSEVKKQFNSQLWLRQESFILHVCCRTLDDAKNLLDTCHKLGLKRAGLTSLKKNVVEIINTPFIDTIAGINGELLVGDNFLSVWLAEANNNLKKNFDKIEELVFEINKY